MWLHVTQHEHVLHMHVISFQCNICSVAFFISSVWQKPLLIWLTLFWRASHTGISQSAWLENLSGCILLDEWWLDRAGPGWAPFTLHTNIRLPLYRSVICIHFKEKCRSSLRAGAPGVCSSAVKCMYDAFLNELEAPITCGAQVVSDCFYFYFHCFLGPLACCMALCSSCVL